MRRIRRALLIGTAGAVLTVVVGGVGEAQALTVKACDGSGTIYVNDAPAPSTQTNWTLEGSGSCPAQLRLLLEPLEAQQITFSGSGTSDSLGLCDGSVLVTNLSLNVTVTYRDVVTGATRTEQQVWSAPITLFPLATPFLISENGEPLVGVGASITRIFLGCDNSGTRPSADFVWTEIRNP
jgi:hypothetical protein